MAATNTNHTSYDENPTVPTAGSPVILDAHITAGTDELDELLDVIRFFKLFDGNIVHDGALGLGDFDSNGTPLCTHSLIITDGTTEVEIILDNIAGRTGAGIVRPTLEAEHDVLPYTVVESGAQWYLGVKTTAAPATANTTTADKTVRVMAIVSKK